MFSKGRDWNCSSLALRHENSTPDLCVRKTEATAFAKTPETVSLASDLLSSFPLTHSRLQGTSFTKYLLGKWGGTFN